jgi:hypothetical protein
MIEVVVLMVVVNEAKNLLEDLLENHVRHLHPIGKEK